MHRFFRFFLNICNAFYSFCIEYLIFFSGRNFLKLRSVFRRTSFSSEWIKLFYIHRPIVKLPLKSTPTGNQRIVQNDCFPASVCFSIVFKIPSSSVSCVRSSRKTEDSVRTIPLWRPFEFLTQHSRCPGAK